MRQLKSHVAVKEALDKSCACVYFKGLAVMLWVGQKKTDTSAWVVNTISGKKRTNKKWS